MTRSALLILTALCMLGLLVSWVPGNFLWQGFQFLTFGLLILWFIRWMAGKAPEAAWHWTILPFIGILALAGIQIGLHWTDYSYGTAVEATKWATFATVFFLGFELSAKGGSQALRKMSAAFGCTLICYSVMQYFAAGGKMYWIFNPPDAASGFGPFLNSDHFATFAILIAPAAAFGSLRNRERWMVAFVTAALYGAVIASQSRAGFAIFTLEMAVIVFGMRISGPMAGLIAVLAVVFAPIVGWQPLYAKFMGDLYAGRRELAQATLHMIAARPWTGSGLGTWTLVYPAYAVRDFGVFANAAHCDWLQWTAEGGLPMTALMGAILAGAVSVARRVPWAIGIPLVFVHCLFDFPMQGRFLPVFVFLMLGSAARAALDSGSAADSESLLRARREKRKAEPVRERRTTAAV